MARAHGFIGRLDVIKSQLDEEVLDEDLRIAMIRWKTERAVGTSYKPYDVFKVVSAQEAKERLERLRKEDEDANAPSDHGSVNSAPQPTDDTKMMEAPAAAAATGSVPDAHADVASPSSPSPIQGVETAPGFARLVPESDHLTQPSSFPASSAPWMVGSPAVAVSPVAVSGPPPVTSSEIVHHLSLNGGVSGSALQRHFECEWSALEPILNKLISEQLLWKRGLLYCPA